MITLARKKAVQIFEDFKNRTEAEGDLKGREEKEGNVITEAEIGEIRPGAKECQQPPEWR